MPMLESEVATNSILLGEHETTGLLPVGFEFERQGARYDHFDVSTEGFITFVRGTRRASPPGHVRLVDQRLRIGARPGDLRGQGHRAETAAGGVPDGGLSPFGDGPSHRARAYRNRGSRFERSELRRADDAAAGRGPVLAVARQLDPEDRLTAESAAVRVAPG